MDDETRSKLKELQVHVPFLKLVIEHLKTLKESSVDNVHHVQHTKMVSLYNLLTNGAKKLQFKTLLKCESVLQKLHTKFEPEINPVAKANVLANKEPLARIDLTGPESPPPIELQILVDASDQEPVEIPTERRQSPIRSRDTYADASTHWFKDKERPKSNLYKNKTWNAASKNGSGEEVNPRRDHREPNLTSTAFVGKEYSKANHVENYVNIRPAFVNDQYHYRRRQPQYFQSNGQNREFLGIPTLAEVRQKLAKVVNISSNRHTPKVAFSTLEIQKCTSGSESENLVNVFNPSYSRTETTIQSHDRQHHHQQQEEQHQEQQRPQQSHIPKHTWNNKNIIVTGGNVNGQSTYFQSDPRLRKIQMHSDKVNSLNRSNDSSISTNQSHIMANEQLQLIRSMDNNMSLQKQVPYNMNNNTVIPLMTQPIPTPTERIDFRRPSQDVQTTRKDPRLAPDGRYGSYGRLQGNTAPNRTAEFKQNLQQIQQIQQIQQLQHHQEQNQVQYMQYIHGNNFQQMHKPNPMLCPHDMEWQARQRRLSDTAGSRRTDWNSNSSLNADIIPILYNQPNYNNLPTALLSTQTTHFNTEQINSLKRTTQYEARHFKVNEPHTFVEFKRARAIASEKVHRNQGHCEGDRAKLITKDIQSDISFKSKEGLKDQSGKLNEEITIPQDGVKGHVTNNESKHKGKLSMQQEIGATSSSNKSAMDLPQLDKLYRSTNINLSFLKSSQSLSFKIPKKVQNDGENCEKVDDSNFQVKKPCEDRTIEGTTSKKKTDQSGHDKTNKKLKNNIALQLSNQKSTGKLSKPEVKTNGAEETALGPIKTNGLDKSPSAAIEALNIDKVSKPQSKMQSINNRLKRRMTVCLNMDSLIADKKTDRKCDAGETSNNIIDQAQNENHNNKKDLNKNCKQKRTKENTHETKNAEEKEIEVKKYEQNEVEKAKPKDQDSSSRKTLRNSISTAVELFDRNKAAMVVCENIKLTQTETQENASVENFLSVPKCTPSARILHRRSTMVEYNSCPLINKREVLAKINKVYEDAHELHSNNDADAERSLSKKLGRRNKSLAEIFEKTDDNCRVSTQNILTGKRRTRKVMLLNETKLSNAVHQRHKKSNKKENLPKATDNGVSAKTCKNRTNAIAKLGKTSKSNVNKKDLTSVDAAAKLSKKAVQKRGVKKSVKLCNPLRGIDGVDNVTVQNKTLTTDAVPASVISNSIAPPVINVLRNWLPPEKLELVMSILGDATNIPSENIASSQSVTVSTLSEALEPSYSKTESAICTKEVLHSAGNSSSTVASTSSDIILPEPGNVKGFLLSKFKKDNVLDAKDKEGSNISLKKKRRSEVDKLNSDLCNVNIDLPAGGRRACTIGAFELLKLQQSSNNSNEERSSESIVKNQSSSKSLRNSVSLSQHNVKTDYVRFKNTARRGGLSGRVWKSYRQANINEANNPNEELLKSVRNCVVKVKRLEISSENRQTRKTLQTQNDKEHITKYITQAELKLTETMESSLNKAVIIKNDNPSWHSFSKYTNFCIVCSEPHSLAKYIQVHEEYYASRLLPSILQRLKEGKFNKPAYYMIVEKQTKYFHRCPFCFQTERLSAGNWLEHFEKHMGHFTYQCSKCKTPKHKLSDIEKHIRRCGQGAKIIKKNQIKDIIELKAHVCHICNYIQLMRGDLDRHYEKQHDIPVDKINKLGYTVVLFMLENVPQFCKSYACQLENQLENEFKEETLLIEKVEGIKLCLKKNVDSLNDIKDDVVDVENLPIEKDFLKTVASNEELPRNKYAVKGFLLADDNRSDTLPMTNIDGNEELTSVLSPDIFTTVEPQVLDSEEDYEKLQDEILRLAEEAEAAEPPSQNGLISIKSENHKDMPLSECGSSNLSLLENNENDIGLSQSSLVADEKRGQGKNKETKEDDWEDVEVNAQKRMPNSNQKGKKNIFKKFNKLLTVISSNKQRITSLSPIDKFSIIESDPAAELRSDVVSCQTQFRSSITTFDSLVSRNESNGDLGKFVPRLTPLEPPLLYNLSQRNDTNVFTKRVVCNVGCALYSEHRKFFCLVVGCKFLFSNEVIGLENHFKSEHPNITWTGHCKSCALNVNGSFANYSLAEEIKHMLNTHIEIQQSPTLENNIMKNQKIKVRRFTGDRISNIATKDLTLNEVPDKQISTISRNCESALVNVKDARHGLSITAVSSGAVAASVIAELEKRETQIKSTGLSSPLQISSIISLGAATLTQNSTARNMNLAQQNLGPVDSNNVVRCEEQRTDTASPEPFVVSEQFVAQETNGDFIITQTVSAQYEENTPMSAPQLDFNISLTPTCTNNSSGSIGSVKPITVACPKPTENIGPTANGILEREPFRCMENKCSFKTFLSNAMRDHLNFHQRQNFSIHRDYLQCAQCSHHASDVDGYLKHTLEMHKIQASSKKDEPKTGIADVTQKIRNILQESKSSSSSRDRLSKTQTMSSKTLDVSVVQALVADTGIPEDNLYTCPINGCLTNLTEASFNTHVVFHRNSAKVSIDHSGSLQCPYCDSVLFKPSSLKQHLRRHAQHRYFCYYCLATRENSNSMRKHLMEKHSARNPFIMDTEITFVPPTSVKTKYYVTFTSELSQAQKDEFGIRLICELEKRRASAKIHFKPNEMDLLPKEMIFTHTLYCEQCQYGTKVRLNMLRHMQQHKSLDNITNDASDGASSTLGGGIGQLASNDPINPVPCLATRNRFFDKMTNLASSSLVTPLLPLTSAATNRDVSNNNGNILATMSETTVSGSSEMMPQYVFVPELKRFTCGVINCSFTTLSEEVFRAHLSSDHKSSIGYVCPFCREEMRLGVNRVLKHLRYHDKHLYKCSECAFLHYYKIVAERHLIERHDRNPMVYLILYQREQAGEMTGQIIQLNSGTGNSKYTRDVAVDVATRSTIAPVRQKSMWECRLCQHSVLTYREILSHCKSVHGTGNRYKCPQCYYSSQTLTDTQAHIDQRHPEFGSTPTLVYEKMLIHSTATPTPTTSVIYSINTKPLWSRNDPKRKRHIRGILMEDEPQSKIFVPKRRQTIDDCLLRAVGNNDDATLTAKSLVDLPNRKPLPEHMEYTCAHCDLQTPDFNYLRAHWGEAHLKNDQTSVPFFYRLQPHMRCAVCLTFVGNSRKMQEHLVFEHKLHNLLCKDVQSQMECAYCHFSYETVQELEFHTLRAQHSPLDLKRLTNAQLDAVLELGQPEKYFQCVICSIIFPSELSVITHCYAVHKTMQDIAFLPLSNVLIYHCATCSYASKDELDTLRHMLNHYERFKCCDYCSKPIEEGFINYAQHLFTSHRSELSNFTNMHTYADLKKFLDGVLYQFPNGLLINKLSLEYTKYGQDNAFSALYTEITELAAKPPIPRLSMAELLSRKCRQAAAKALQPPNRKSYAQQSLLSSTAKPNTATITNKKSYPISPILLRINNRRHTVAVQHDAPLRRIIHCDVGQPKTKMKSAAEC